MALKVAHHAFSAASRMSPAARRSSASACILRASVKISCALPVATIVSLCLSPIGPKLLSIRFAVAEHGLAEGLVQASFPACSAVAEVVGDVGVYLYADRLAVGGGITAI